MAKGRSARGVSVDFDAIKIKEQLAERPAPVEVQAREDFVDQRLKRRARRRAQEAARKEQASKLQEEAIESEQSTDDVDEVGVDDADSLLDDLDGDNEDDVEITTDSTSTTRKQKAPKRKG